MADRQSNTLVRTVHSDHVSLLRAEDLGRNHAYPRRILSNWGRHLTGVGVGSCQQPRSEVRASAVAD
jgi:hypothetical protein